MAKYGKKDKKDKKSKKSALKRIAGKAPKQTSKSEYLKFSDLNPSDVHQGDVTYRGVTYKDRPSTNRNVYSMNVKRGHGKSAFIFQGKLYKHTNSFGTQYQEVKV